MSIEAKCTQCGSVHHVNDRLAGRRFRCPQCSAAVTVPAIATSAEAIERTTGNGELVQGSPAATEANVAGAADFTAHVRSNATSLVGSPVPSLASSRVTTLSEPSGPTVPQATAPAAADDDDDVMPTKLRPDDGELDMTPMVDVTFLLLIFFMITAAFSLQKSLESPRQQSDQPSSQPKEEPDPEELDIVTVQINEFGSYLVLAPDWERETPGKQNLILALRDAMGDGSSPVKLDIQVHESAKLQALVDCMDAGTICDYGEVQVTQVEGFD